MYGHGRGSGRILTAAIVASGKKRVFFPIVTIAASPLNFRRKQQQKNPSGTQGIRGHAAPGNFLDFNSLKSPFISWDPTVIQTGYWPVPFSSDKALQLGKFFL